MPFPHVFSFSDLQQDADRLAALAHSEKAPIFITKDDKPDLVLMSAERYEQNPVRLEVYDKLAQSQEALDAGRVLSLEESFAKYREKFT